MISTEMLRRYTCFAGFDYNQLRDLAKAGEETSVDVGHYFLREDEELDYFYLILEGTVAITLEVPDRAVYQPRNNHITGDWITKELTVGSIGEGELFGWSALIPPNISTASAKAMIPCRVVAFDCQALRPIIEQDCSFGYLLTLMAAKVIRERLRDLRMETLADVAY